MILLWLGIGGALAQVGDLEFASEHVLVGASPAALREGGVLVEAQTHWMPGFRSPTGLLVVPVVPRLAVGVGGRARAVRWTVLAHGFGVLPVDGSDRGAGGGLAGGFTVGVPEGRIRAGLEANAQLLSFRSFDDAYRRWTFETDLVSGYDIGLTTVTFRMGALAGRTRSDTVRLGVRTTELLEPRMGLGLSVHPTPRWTVGLFVRSGVRALIPRVPFTAVLSGTFQISRFAPD